MCYYSFVEYDCGCAPLDPVRVPTTDDCPQYCRGEPPMRLDSTRHLRYKCSNCQHAARPGVPGPNWREQAHRYGVKLSSMPQYDENYRQREAEHQVRRVQEEKASAAAVNPEDWMRREDGTWRRKYAYEKSGEDTEKKAAARLKDAERHRQARAAEAARSAARDPEDWVQKEDGMYRRKTAAEKREDEREKEWDRRTRRGY